MTVLASMNPIKDHEEQIRSASYIARQEAAARFVPPAIMGEPTADTKRLNQLLDNQTLAGLVLARVIDCKRDCPADPSSLVGLEAAIRALGEYRAAVKEEYSALLIRGCE